MPFDAGSIISKLKLDKSGWDASVTKVKGDETKLKGVASRSSENFKKMGLAMTLAGGAIVAGLRDMVLKASDAEETFAKFGTVFSDVAGEAGQAAEDLADDYGLSELAAKDLLSATGDLLTGLGVNSEAALDLSTKTQQLAVDLASFTNFSGGAKGASEALTKAMLGERESIKSLGIVITEEMVKEELLAIGKQDLTGLARKQAAAEVTLKIAVQQSKNAIGDYERTSGSFANQQRLLLARLEDVRVELGEKLLPIVTQIITKISDTVLEITDWTKENPALTETLIKITAALGATMLVVGPLLIALPKLAAGIKLVKKASATAAGPIGILTAGLLLIAERARSATKDFKSFTDLVEKEAESQGEKIGWLKKTWAGLNAVTDKYVLGIDTTKLAMQAYTEHLDEANRESTDWAGTLTGLVGWAGQVAEAYDQKMTPALKGATGEVQTFSEQILTATNKSSNLVFQINLWKNEVISLETVLEGAQDTLKGFYETAVPAARDMSGVYAEALGEMEEETERVFGEGGPVRKTMGEHKTAWGTYTDGLQTKWATAFSDMIEMPSWMRDEIAPIFQTIYDQFADMVGSMISKWLTGFITEFVSSTKGAAETVVGTVKDVATAATDLAKGFSPTGMIASAIGSAIGTFLGSLLGPKGPSANDMRLVKDNTWATNQNVINLHDAMVLRLDEIKISNWTREGIQGEIFKLFGDLPDLIDVGHNLLRRIIGHLNGIGLNLNALVGIMKKVTGFAAEGIAWEPQLAMVAERGPEVILNLERMQQGQIPGQGGNTIVFNIQTWDAVDTERWIRDQGLALIEEGLRQNVGGTTEKIEESLAVYRKR